MTYAAILGLYLVIKFYISVFSEKSALLSSLISVLTLLVPYIIFRFQKKYRDEQLNGFISYSSAFTYGVSLFFYASLILALGQFVFYQFISPEYLTNAFKASIDLMEKMGIPEKIIDEAINMTMPSAISTVLQTILINNVMGIVISAITSSFVKKTDLFNTTHE